MFYKRDDSENTADCPISPPSAIRDESVKWKRYAIARSLNNLRLSFERLVENARNRRKLLRSGERRERVKHPIYCPRQTRRRCDAIFASRCREKRRQSRVKERMQRRLTSNRQIDGWFDASGENLEILTAGLHGREISILTERWW